MSLHDFVAYSEQNAILRFCSKAPLMSRMSLGSCCAWIAKLTQFFACCHSWISVAKWTPGRITLCVLQAGVFKTHAFCGRQVDCYAQTAGVNVGRSCTLMTGLFGRWGAISKFGGNHP